MKQPDIRLKGSFILEATDDKQMTEEKIQKLQEMVNC